MIPMMMPCLRVSGQAKGSGDTYIEYASTYLCCTYVAGSVRLIILALPVGVVVCAQIDPLADRLSSQLVFIVNSIKLVQLPYDLNVMN